MNKEQECHEFDDCTASPTGKHSESWFANGDCEYCKAGAQPNAPLFYAAPAAPQPAQQPLTDEQIYDLYRRAGLDAYHLRDDVVQHAYDNCINDFVRAIERTHGIGVKND